LEPATGALVELIRAEHAGGQLGVVLATACSSLTGGYRLALPPGVGLAGSLVVRLAGRQPVLRAPAGERTVDIDPVPEPVRRELVEQGTNLGSVVVNEVVTLSSRVAEFDLTAGFDLSDMFERLEAEVGDFVERQIEVVKAAPGNVSDIAGEYRSMAFSFELDDSDSSGWGTFWSEIWDSQFTFASNANGAVSVTHFGEDSYEFGVSGPNIANAEIWFEVDLEQEVSTYPATYRTNGLLSIQGQFDEELDDNSDNGFRWPATVYNLQQVKGKGLFVQLAHEAGVRYGTVDTNDEGQPDALDPNARRGDEIVRSLEFVARKPTARTAANLNGNFGRVYLESSAAQSHLEIRADTTLVSFNGDATFDVGATSGHSLVITSEGTRSDVLSEDGEANLPVTVTADGSFTEIGGE